MKAKLKYLHSPDIDLDSFWPENPENFGFLLQAMIGPENQKGEESFDMQVCTPDWLKAHNEKEDIVFGRHLLIVFEYDISLIKNKISKYCDDCMGEDWQSISARLGRIGRWEFEDYTPEATPN